MGTGVLRCLSLECNIFWIFEHYYLHIIIIDVVDRDFLVFGATGS